VALRYTPRLEEAIRVAAIAHRKQMRKGGKTPYIVHPFSVMTIASTVTDDEDTLIAALFHDIIEDVPEEYNETLMREHFGDKVVAIVRDVTHDDGIRDWRERSEAYLEHLRKACDEAVIVSGGDKIHNLMSTLDDYDTIGEDVWQIFTTKSAADQLWWYESVLAVLQDRKAPKPLVDQLGGLVSQLRKIVKAQA
jgi:(p)ppGpp synthase/HD superfamily hydrolase